MLDTNAISCEYMYEYGHQREGFYKDLGVPWQISNCGKASSAFGVFGYHAPSDTCTWNHSEIKIQWLMFSPLIGSSGGAYK